MTRVVLDTNIFVSSFFGGKPRRIIELWAAGRITLCLSAAIVDEYVAVLRRMGLQDQAPLEALFDLFRRGHHCLFTATAPELRVVLDDPDDDKFVECTVALKAPFIVSGDKALLAIGNYLGVKILIPAMFLFELDE